MSRRHAKEELSFGSDSFLDIIANIVGILIILIVVAGVRVSQNPIADAAHPEPKMPAAVEHRMPLFLPPIPEVEAETEPVAVAAAAIAPPEPVTLPVPPEPPAELVQEARRLEDQMAALDQQTQSTAQELRLSREQVAAIEAQLVSAKQQVSTAQDALRRQSNQSAQSEKTYDRLQAEFAELQRELLIAESERTPARQIEHRLTPVSRVVDGPEFHFRLSEGRVAAVPVDDLIERLRRDVERNKDWIARTPRYQGQVGPVRGFTMTYIVQRRPLSIVDELRHGRGIVQIGISQWKIEPASDLVAESVEEALRPGSRFYQALLSAPRDATFTFWVYPDSFGLHRQLQSFAQREGFTVAARPLPFGIPIAGSPNGTRSAAQ